MGQAHVKHTGLLAGNIDTWYFNRLAKAAVGIGFFELRDRYTCAVTDNPTVYVAVTRFGQRKVIEHYAPDMTGPAALLLFEESIDAAEQFIKWSPK
ncbi:MAG: hypothetical protein QOK37_4670 [Thermoanaerobaculia bacterium]|jgi:hypothetical protein|nr:hypothetical protein [Thermoanaerobaculia bacterium]